MNASHDQMDLVDRARLVESGGARDDSPSWILDRAKQGDTIRVDGASPWEGQGQEDVKESESGCFRVQRAQGQAANESAGRRKAKESSEGPEDWTTVSVDENIIDEFQVSSKTTENCVEPTIILSIEVKRKLSQSEVDRMVQEAEKSRDEGEVNESNHEAESGLEKFQRYCVKHTD